MNRVPLKESGVKNIKDFDWLFYFEYNNSHLLKLDFTENQELTSDEIHLIAPSIRAFQIGEGSDGRHLNRVVENFADKADYPQYKKIMDWFIIEENRHSQTLKKYMEIYNISSAKALWLDNVFRLLRRLMGLECEVIVLVTAEMIALSYYSALSNATNSILLKTICRQMLNDELKHVVLQSDTLNRISKGRGAIFNNAVRKIRKILMRLTCFVVFFKYKNLFAAGGYSYKKFKSDSMEYLRESICIERNLDYEKA